VVGPSTSLPVIVKADESGGSHNNFAAKPKVRPRYPDISLLYIDEVIPSSNGTNMPLCPMSEHLHCVTYKPGWRPRRKGILPRKLVDLVTQPAELLT